MSLVDLNLSPYRFSYSPEIHPPLPDLELQPVSNETVIFLKGEFKTTKDLLTDRIKKCYIVAIDDGLKNCTMLSIIPDMIVVDESISEDIRRPFRQGKVVKKLAEHIELIDLGPKTVEFHTVPHDKDLTNTEYAIDCLHEKDLKSAPNKKVAERITIIGTQGLKEDYTVRKLSLAARFPGKVFLESVDTFIFVIDKKVKATVTDLVRQQKVSLYPIFCEAVKSVVTKGLRWELKKRKLDLFQQSKSNQTVGKSFKISIKAGRLTVVVTKSAPEPALVRHF